MTASGTSVQTIAPQPPGDILRVLVLALIMSLVAATTALAAGTGSIELYNTDGSAATYDAYRIANANAEPTSALDWDALRAANSLGGAAIRTADASTPNHADNGRNFVLDTSDVIAQDNDGSLAAELATYLADGAQAAASITVNAGPVSVDDGWYLLVSEGRRPLLAWVDSTGDAAAVRLADKADAPTLAKEVAGADGVYGDSATYGAGTTLSYRLTYTAPLSYESFRTYATSISDTWDEGLTIDEGSITVLATVAGEETDVTSSDQVHVTVGDTSLTVSIDDLKQLGLLAGDTIQVTYQMTGTTDNPGASGLLNTAHATYPRFDGAGTTEDVTTRVYTFAARVHKASTADKTALSGATFALRNSSGDWLQADGTFGPESTRATVTTDASGDVTVATALDAGTYVLVELAAPAGYVLPDTAETTVTVSATTTADDVELSVKAEGAGTVDAVDATSASFTIEVLNAASPADSGNNGGSGTRTLRSLLPKTGDTSVAQGIVCLVGVAVAVIVAAIIIRRRGGSRK